MGFTGKDKQGGYLPMLLDVQVSSDFYSPGDVMWLTARWRNTGSAASARELKCFLDFEFGYQRALTDTPRYHRHIVDPVPGFMRHAPGQDMFVTMKRTMHAMWGGTFNLFLGLLDEEHNPVEFIGVDGRPCLRTPIGCIELSWGWGKPALDLVKSPWDITINEAPPAVVPEAVPGTLSIADAVTVRLRQDMPVVTGYGCGKAGFDFNGQVPEIIVRHYEEDELFSSDQPEVRVDYSAPSLSGNKAVYSGVVHVGNEEAADFDIAFEVTGNVLSVQLEGYAERNGFEFIEVRLPALAALGGPDAFMATMAGGDRLVKIETARQNSYLLPYDVRNAAALYNDDILAVMEAFSLDDRVYLAVEGEGAGKVGILGSTLAARVAARKRVKSIETPPGRVEVALFERQGSGPGWLSFAKYLRRTLTGKNNHIHRRTFHYAFYSSQGPEPWDWQVNEDSPYPVARLNRGIKIKDLPTEIRKVYNILDGYHQVPFLYGYHKQNNEDHTANWAPTEPDLKRAGTPEDFRRAVIEAREYNTDLVLYENFDHVYKHGIMPHEMAAMDMFGGPWKGWTWADGVSIEAGWRKFVESGVMKARVKKMNDVWGPRVTGYIDVLSSEVLRWDFDPEHPASAQTSLAFRHELVHEYNRQGMDVYSETLTDPWVGVQGYAWSARITPDNALFEADTYIPMVNALYHGIIGYNRGCGNRTGFLKALRDAGGYGIEFDGPLPQGWIKWAYLQQLPLGLLFDEQVEDIVEGDGRYSILYSNDCAVHIEQSAMKYEIVWQGRTVGRDWTTFVPSTKEDGWLAYSYSGGEMRYAAPEEWAEGEKKIQARILTFEGLSDESVPCRIEDGEIVLDMPQDKPVKVTVG